MNIFKRACFLLIVVLISVSFSSCSKNNFSHNYQAKSLGTSPSLDPVTKKSSPVRKNYLVPDKKKRILGQQKPRI